MIVTLLTKNKLVAHYLKQEFSSTKNTFVYCQTFKTFMDSNNNIDCVVSPANSYGLMDGTYDLALTSYFGGELQEVVQKKILKEFNGEQPLCSSLIVNIPNTKIKLIHTPTMRIPSVISDPMIIYHCTRSSLLLAKKNKIKNILLPAFGTGCGLVESDIAAHLMKEGYNQVFSPQKEINWKTSLSKTKELEEYLSYKLNNYTYK